MSITHTQPSTAPDGTIPGFIQPSHWNATHTVDLANEYTSAVHVDLRKTCTMDGVANDTGAFSAAITAAVALAPVVWVYVAPGKTVFTDMFTHSTVNTVVRFYGGGAIKLRTGGTALLRCTAGLVIADGVKLDGSNLTITNGGLGLVYVAGSTAYCEVSHCEIFNVGLAGSFVGNGICSNTGGKLRARFNNIHDCLGYGIRIQSTGKFDISHNEIHDCGNSAVFGGQTTTGVISDGGMVLGNLINNIRADQGGSGQNGNGISLWNLDNVIVGPNVLKDVAFSFVRVNSCSDGSITGVVGVNAGETGIFLEFGTNNYSVTGCVLKSMNSWGISVANLPQGVRNVVVSGCHVFDFGKTGTRSAGIQIEYGVATGNIIDGNGNAAATWGISTAPSGLTSSWQSRIAGNEIAGCKYDIGIPVSSVSGTQRMVVVGNNHFRSDANYASPIGAIAGGTTDGGNGSAIGAAMAARVFWDNFWNVPTAEAPPAGEVGSRMKINGSWWTADTAGVWRNELATSTETITYSASMTPGTFTTMSRISTITATNTTAFTINAVPGTPLTGALQSFVIRRSSASALGALTWNAIYKVGTWTQPSANNTSRSVTFQYNGTNWIEINRTSVDVPN